MVESGDNPESGVAREMVEPQMWGKPIKGIQGALVTLTAENLVGYVRAEFAKASGLRVALFFVQLAVALPLAISVVVPDHEKVLLYWLALLSGGLLIVWWVLNGYYIKARAAGQTALRGALLLGGLGQQLSASEVQSLRERLTVRAEDAAKCEMADYYATKLPPGSARLAEMLEESALLSERLQEISARAMLVVLGIFGLCFFVISLAVSPFVQNDTTYLIVRVFMAMLVFALSADVFGAYRMHKTAAQEIKEIRYRLTNADKLGYPLPDVMLAFIDYLAAIETAPEVVPYVYGFYSAELNKRWQTYLSDRQAARASR